ncbi:hypothetical protein PAXRUDRAFT_822217 [Paxillus rubicundulus Ve08.2h10]|uniref:BTB domain-containing protein n=1 Tax=Paxillus rubicundulus Ve08.2h10 TaxID=930991 RepID=A0A0D0ECT8_9AGAM|nr:hypothetical protein PAXRUDRAFT_822217 [Paxillus rubicundulus Ve08.2h10]
MHMANRTSALHPDTPTASRAIHTSLSLPDIYLGSPRPTRRLGSFSATRHPPMTPTGLSSVDLQQHIYNSLLESRTADVALHVRGTWEAVYKLHRVVLIQSGFFSSLFTAGFLESLPKLSSHPGPEQVDIVFDDRNITRAAFEICIARLYGGGPPLHISPSLIPTTLHPLTPSFPGPAPPIELPQGHHPATPNFLLSLLATSVYLSIPSVASQALSHILNTVGPYTAVHYLIVATGTAVDSPGEDELEAAVGLEKIAEIVRSPTITNSAPLYQDANSDNPDSRDILADRLHELDMWKEGPAESDNESEAEDRPSYTSSFNYGAVSDKIGEAAVCWLARWGPDMLVYEEKASRARDQPAVPVTVSIPPVVPRRRAETLPSRPLLGNASLPTLHRVPVIWARGGLTSTWIRWLVSSDSLFVKGERERYDLARTVVELRRRQGIDEDEERDWEVMFSEGIYYTNMLVDDIIAISRDVSPTTGRAFVPISVLQVAHWNQSLLRCHITAKPGGSSAASTPPPPGDKELGLSSTTAEILSCLSKPQQPSAPDERDKVYYPVAQDSSLRIGDSNGIEGASMDQLFDPPTPPTDSKSPTRAATSEANFFGLMAERKTATECVSSDVTGKARWSPYPPYRFAVEFWDIDSLKEKSRLHSHTIWYAGSLFNVYVQVVRKKGIQLGIYLHRQSTVDPIPGPSAPVQVVGKGERNHQRVPSLPQPIPASVSLSSVHYSPSIHPPTRSTTPHSTPSTSSGAAVTYESTGNSIPATATPVAPIQPYRDSRPSISAYFSISCTSSTGSSMTRFTSVPDVFSVSQSWGWKSSSLRTEIGETGADGQPVKPPVPAPRELSLRATVVLGIV